MSDRRPCCVCRSTNPAIRADMARVFGEGKCGDPTCCNYNRPETQDADERAMLDECAAFWKTVPSAPDEWKKER